MWCRSTRSAPRPVHTNVARLPLTRRSQMVLHSLHLFVQHGHNNMHAFFDSFVERTLRKGITSSSENSLVLLELPSACQQEVVQYGLVNGCIVCRSVRERATLCRLCFVFVRIFVLACAGGLAVASLCALGHVQKCVHMQSHAPEACPLDVTRNTSSSSRNDCNLFRRAELKV